MRVNFYVLKTLMKLSKICLAWSATYSSINLNWNNRTLGPYTQTQANLDFGAIYNWNQSKADIALAKDNTTGCRITLAPNSTGTANGIVGIVSIATGQEYQVDFDVMFNWNFTWGLAGKVGFGFSVGEGNSGCDPSWDGNGGSFRIVWYHIDRWLPTKRVVLKPYVYHVDMPNTCGDDFNGKIMASFEILERHASFFFKNNTGFDFLVP